MESKHLSSAITELMPVPEGIRLTEIVVKAEVLSELAKDLRAKILNPKPRKDAPVFSMTEVAEICGIDRIRANYLLSREEGGLPKGQLKGKQREFTLEELFVWVDQVKNVGKPPAGKSAATLIFANFKGGSTKSTSSMCVAQGLSLRGRKVLLVDLDPQGSLTELCGFYTDLEISAADTVASYIGAHLYKEELPADGLAGYVKETYWKNLDLIPSSNEMFGIEFSFPQIASKYPDTQIWKLLSNGLAPLKESYDYILLDTAPSLSYMTINALMAADSIFMPLVPDGLDFISSIQFWKLFGDISLLLTASDEEKVFDLVHVLLSKVDNTKPSVEIVRQWAKRTYGEWVLSTEVPFSSAASSGALAFSTVFDMTKESAYTTKKTVDRLKQPFLDICENIDNFYLKKWSQA